MPCLRGSVVAENDINTQTAQTVNCAGLISENGPQTGKDEWGGDALTAD